MSDITNTITNSSPTMSSREIAEICGTRHNQVVETIERLFENGVLRESRKTTRAYRPDGGGRPTEVYDLTKRDTLVVVSGYNDEVRAKIIDRWMELESAPAQPAIPTNLPDALRLAADLAEARAAAEAKITAMTPIVEAFEELASADGFHNLRDSAKQCGWTERAFVSRLMVLGWIYAAPVTGRKCAYAEKIKAGLMDVKNVEFTHRDGRIEGVGQPMITQKGLARLRVVLGPQPGRVIANFQKQPERVS